VPNIQQRPNTSPFTNYAQPQKGYKGYKDTKDTKGTKDTKIKKQMHFFTLKVERSKKQVLFNQSNE
jgi:hypothetical protein